MSKGIIAILTVFALLTLPALAELDVSAMTDDELRDCRLAINEEIAARIALDMPEGEGRIIDLFPDPVLANLVRGEIGAFTVEDIVTQDDLDSVEEVMVLSHNDGLESLEGIQYLHNLEVLHLYWQDRLKEIPDAIGTLTRLEELSVKNCGITALPDSVCNLTWLEKLDISGTAVTALPEDIGNLESLEELDISETQIKDLPESIYALDLKKFYR